MNIPDVRLRKLKLERAILDLIMKFENETEASVADIELRQATVLGSHQSHTISVGVAVTI